MIIESEKAICDSFCQTGEESKLEHSVEIWRFFCQSEFYVKSVPVQIHQNQNHEYAQLVKIVIFWKSKCKNWFHVKSKRQKNPQISTLWNIDVEHPAWF